MIMKSLLITLCIHLIASIVGIRTRAPFESYPIVCGMHAKPSNIIIISRIDSMAPRAEQEQKLGQLFVKTRISSENSLLDSFPLFVISMR